MPRPIGQSRTAVKLSTPLHGELTVYALAAGAAGVSVLALPSPAEAEVVYTNVHHIIRRNETYAIDFNHDGLTDITIENLFHAGHFSVTMLLNVVPASAGGYAVESHVRLAAALPRGATIGVNWPSRPERLRSFVMASYGYIYGYSTGSWFNVSNRYLGLGFRIDGKLHYGWARLSTNSRGLLITAELTGFAYETEPNTPIIAGDTGGVSRDDSESAPTSDAFSTPQPDVKPAAGLGALALGARGLAIWRREDSQLRKLGNGN
jgi:hypothetical protein